MKQWIIPAALLAALTVAPALAFAQDADTSRIKTTAAPEPRPAPVAPVVPPAPIDPGLAPQPDAAGRPATVTLTAPRLLVKSPAKTAPATYLGAATSRAAPALREQLKLTKGTGLVVGSVDPRSPAEAAGLQQHDVIEKLNDQLLVNVEQLSALIHSMKSGDEVTLAVVRQGEHKSLKAKLVTKESTGNEVGIVNVLHDAPNAGAWKIVTAGEPQAMAWVGPPPAMMGGAPITFHGNVLVRNRDGKQSTEWSDGDVHIAVEKEGDKTANVTIKDAAGKTLFKGAAPDEADPFFKQHPDLREKLKKAEDAAATPPMKLLIQARGMESMIGGDQGKVVRWQDDDHVLILRRTDKNPVYLLALSKKDGRILYDGPVMTDDQRKNVPDEVSEQFQLLLAKPELAKEFGGEQPDKTQKPGR